MPLTLTYANARWIRRSFSQPREWRTLRFNIAGLYITSQEQYRTLDTMTAVKTCVRVDSATVTDDVNATNALPVIHIGQGATDTRSGHPGPWVPQSIRIDDSKGSLSTVSVTWQLKDSTNATWTNWP